MFVTLSGLLLFVALVPRERGDFCPDVFASYSFGLQAATLCSYSLSSQRLVGSEESPLSLLGS